MRAFLLLLVSTLHIPSLVGVWPLERISHLSTRRRIMATKKICLILAALLGLSGVLPATATDNEAADYLPLAVGNSWTYSHDYYDQGLSALGGESALYPTIGRLSLNSTSPSSPSRSGARRSSTARRITYSAICQTSGRRPRRTSLPARSCAGRVRT